MTQPDLDSVESRYYARRDIDNYPIIVKLLDGTTIRAYLSSISYSGLQIKCKQLAAFILMHTPKSGLLAKEDETDVKISLILPIKNKLKKIMVNCKLKYVAVTKDSRPEYAYAIGLQITDYKGKSFQIIKEILDGLALPDLKSNVVPIKDS